MKPETWRPHWPGVQNPFRPDNPDSTGNNGSLEPDGIPDNANDFDGDGVNNLAELNAGTSPIGGWPSAADLKLTLTIVAPSSEVRLTWAAEPHATYEVRWSNDLVLWTPIATGTLTAGPAGGMMSWSDNGPPATPVAPVAAGHRFYSVARLR